MNKWRNTEKGLVEKVKYSYNEDGSINWRKMVDERFLYPNPDKVKRKEGEPESIEGLADNELCILLGGFKELAKLRGYEGVEYILSGSSKHIVMKCRITFSPNFETDGKPVVFESIASVHSGNTDDFGMRYGETIAENRAFVRCVRNFLNINVVGADEIDAKIKHTKEEGKAADVSVHGMLQDAAGCSLEAFKDVKLRDFWKNETYQNKDAADWKEWKDIPAKEARKLLVLLKKS